MKQFKTSEEFTQAAKNQTIEGFGLRPAEKEGVQQREEIIMLAEKNEYISEAADTIYHLTQDEKIRMQCEAREDYYRTRRGWQDMLEEKDAMLKEMDAMLKEKDAMLKEKDAMLEEKDAIIRLQESALAEQKAALETVGSELNNLVTWAKKQGYEE